MANEKIVISGIAGAFPNIENVAEFYTNLDNKIKSFNQIDPYWQIVTPGVPSVIGKLTFPEKFDAGYFGVHHKQADEMHQGCRMLLEQAVAAVIDSGINPDDLKGSKTGVFVANSVYESSEEWIWRKLSSPSFSLLGSKCSAMAEWISYYLQLQGPTVTSNSACASSLYSLDQAVMAIKTGKCDSALICSFNVIQNPHIHFGLTQLGVLETNGVTNVFDDSCTGYVRSEAMAVVFLQKFQDAKRIYAEILNIKSNTDGFKEMGISHPSDEMLIDLVKEIYDEVGVDLNTVSFVECHVTGTAAGMSQEIKGVEEAFCSDRKTPLLIGSVKAGIGHCEGASGLASLIKILIGLQHNCILPNQECQQLTRKPDALQNGKLVVLTERLTLPSDQDVIIGCNNFGFGGTNSHLVLKHCPNFQSTNLSSNSNRLVCFSARTMSSLTKIINSLADNQTEEYLALLQNIFKQNVQEHWYRAYTILNNGKILSNSVRFCNEKLQMCLVYPHCTREWLKISKTVQKMPLLSRSINRIRNVLLPKGVDVYKLWKQKEIDFGDLIIATTALQIIITDLLNELLQERITLVQGFSWGVIASAYAKGTLSLEHAVLLAFELKNCFNKITSVECMKNEQSILKEIKRVCQETKTISVPALLKDATLISPKVIKIVIGADEMNEQCCFNSNASFLNILGRLYVLGFNLNLDKLYPNASWPVKAPSISPLIQWQHKDDWDILKYEMKNLSTDVATISLEHNHWKFLTGHVVDGRTVLPGTGYLFIVWNFYLKVNRFLMNQTKIIFEHVKFYGLTFLFKQKPVALTVNLMKLQNKFEVLHGNDLLVTGKIRALATDSEFTNFVPKPLPQETMNTKDVYRNLTLSGYNYNDEFRCVQQASLDGTIGSIKWYNWITFLDNLFHFTVLNNQQHHLLIPFEFDQLFIDPLKHGQALYQYNNVLPIHYNPVCNRINAPGVEIRNLILSSIKKQSQKDPYLGIYKFVPFYTNLSLENSVKVHIQLVAENLINTLKIIEVVDAFTSDTNELLYPIVDNVLDNEYSFIENLSIFSTKTLDYPNTIVKYKTIEQLPSGLSLVIMSCGSQRQTAVAQILENRSSFVLSRESLKYEKFKHIEVISTHRTNSENLVLLRKSRKIPQKVIEIKSDFGWLEQLKSTLLQNQKVLLVAQNDPTSGILGLVNCLKQEVDQNVSCLFLSDRVKRFDLEDDFYQKQLRKGLLINVFKNGQWGSYKHLPLYQGQKSCEHVIGVSRGKLTNIEFVQGPFTKKSLISDKDLIDIYCVGLNFKNAGATTEEISNVESNFEDLGTEFAGKDSKNSRIMGISLNSVFSNCISANTSITCQIPDEWSMEDAATVPAIYLTVLHALLKIARLKHGQSILIHSGTDNVGQSAINVALYYNCNIFTTIDSKEKRHYLKTLYPNILDSHIGNLGDTEFEQIILKQTNGRGVDVVLSSLTDDKLSASIRCLNQSGIFVFLGKPDNKFFIDEVFERRTYASVSVDTFFNQPLNNKKEILSLLQEGITKGYVKPLPKTVYHRDQLQNNLSLSKHTNKIVIQIKNESVDNHSLLNAKPRFYCDPDKVYILIGGLGGFGLELTDWLITRNAKKIILVSRSGVTTGYQSYKLYCWKNLDCKVLSSQDDLTTEDGCIKLLTEANALGDVDGIFNLAIDLHDALIENQNENTFKTIWAPKVLITRNMDTISKKLCPRLRKFVMFSSLVCGRGNSGQSNYGMANSVAERICEQRKEDGYPALVIQWAFIGDVGLVADTPSAKVSIDRIRKQNIASCWNVIDTLLTHEETIVSSTVFDSKEIKQNANSNDLLSTVAEFLGETSLKHISMHSELSSLGINSISIIQLAQYLSAECNLHISLKELRNMTLHMLVEKNNAPKNST